MKILQDFILMLHLKEFKKLFVLTFENIYEGDEKVQRKSHIKYFIVRVNITNCSALTGGRNFYDRSINDQIKKM